MGPKKVPVGWGAMAQAVTAIWVPLAVGIASGNRSLALLPAMGGLMSIMVAQGGPYLLRVRRVATAGVGGGAFGLLIGSLIHGRGWVAVAVLVVGAGGSPGLPRPGRRGVGGGRPPALDFLARVRPPGAGAAVVPS